MLLFHSLIIKIGFTSDFSSKLILRAFEFHLESFLFETSTAEGVLVDLQLCYKYPNLIKVFSLALAVFFCVVVNCTRLFSRFKMNPFISFLSVS